MRATALCFGLVMITASACSKEPDEGKPFGDSSGTDGATTMDMPSADDSGTGTSSTGDTGTTDTGTGTTDTGTGDTGTTDTGTTSDTGDTTTSGGGSCGNGTVDSGEQCDGGNLNGLSCMDLGFSAGTLACDPVSCVYDTSSCTTTGSTTG